MKKLSRVLPWLPVLAALTPLIASGQMLQTILTDLSTMVTTVTYLLMAVALLVFMWGIVKFITAGGNMEKRKTAHGYIIYGLIGLFVMIAFWGIIKILLITFNIQEGGTVTPPEVILHP